MEGILLILAGALVALITPILGLFASMSAALAAAILQPAAWAAGRAFPAALALARSRAIRIAAILAAGLFLVAMALIRTVLFKPILRGAMAGGAERTGILI
jgi:hypothetical protein